MRRDSGASAAVAAPGCGTRSRARRRRIGVAVLLVIALVVNLVPPVRDGVSSLLSRGVTSLVSSLTGRDAEVKRLTKENLAVSERARSAEERLAAVEESATLSERFGGGKHDVVVGHAVAFTPAPSTGSERKVELDIGSRDGISLSQAVVGNRGLVGRITAVRADSSTVTLLADPSSVVGARVERTRSLARLSGSAPAGVAKRSGSEVSLVVADGGSVRIGDTVVTAGSPNGFPYPAGIPLGKVSRVEADHGQAERNAAVRPFVDPGALEVVGVLVPQENH